MEIREQRESETRWNIRKQPRKETKKKNQFHLILHKARWVWSTTKYKRDLNSVYQFRIIISGLLCPANHTIFDATRLIYYILEIQFGSLKKKNPENIQTLPIKSKTQEWIKFQNFLPPISGKNYYAPGCVLGAGLQLWTRDKWFLSSGSSSCINGASNSPGVMGKSLDLFELPQLQMFIHYSVYKRTVKERGFKEDTCVNLRRKGLFKSKCLLNIDVFYHMDTIKHLFCTAR